MRRLAVARGKKPERAHCKQQLHSVKVRVLLHLGGINESENGELRLGTCLQAACRGNWIWYQVRQRRRRPSLGHLGWQLDTSTLGQQFLWARSIDQPKCLWTVSEVAQKAFLGGKSAAHRRRE